MVVQGDARRRIRTSLFQWVLVPSWLQATVSAVWVDSAVVRFIANPLRAAMTVTPALLCTAVILWLVWRRTGQCAGVDIKAELKAARHFGVKLAVIWRWYRVMQVWLLIWAILTATAVLLNTLGVIAAP